MAHSPAASPDCNALEMPAPDNTLPMMTGFGQFGPIEMGGMFTVVKVRDELAANDYKDPGWFKHPQGTVAYEWQGEQPSPARAQPKTTQSKGNEIELKAVKPDGKGHQQH